MKHWVFDLDGTLVDSLTIHFQIMKRVFRQYELPFSEKTEHEVLSISGKDLPSYFKDKFGSENFRSALARLQELAYETIPSIRSFEGIEPILSFLQSQGLALAIWTGRDLGTTTKILEHAGLARYFSICVTGNCVEQGKPHPEGLEKIARHFQCAPESMVMVGDFESDMIGAKSFGATAVRVFWQQTAPVKTCELSDYQFTRVEDFSAWVRARGAAIGLASP